MRKLYIVQFFRGTFIICVIYAFFTIIFLGLCDSTIRDNMWSNVYLLREVYHPECNVCENIGYIHLRLMQ
jgi:hypothetical protein